MGDSIVIFLLALMLFGPKKLPQLARQLGKLMAEFRKASNDFRMQMEDELRIEEQKEHQAKVDALKPPPSETPNPDIPTEDPPHPHMPAYTPDADAGADAEVDVETRKAPTPEPIAASGDLKMMPPASGLPLESSARGRSYATPEIPEHSMADSLPLTAETTLYGAGTSSEEPAAELEPPPDRGHPVMAGEGERATHV